MSPEEAKRLTKGDVVLVPCLIYVEFGDDDFGILKSPGGETFYAHPDAIHSVLPRPLAVGDRVTGTDGNTSATGNILAVNDEWAWVLCDDDGEPCSYRLYELERAP